MKTETGSNKNEERKGEKDRKEKDTKKERVRERERAFHCHISQQYSLNTEEKELKTDTE